MPKPLARTSGYSNVMKCLTSRLPLAWLGLSLAAGAVAKAQVPALLREFRPGALQRLEDLPAGRFRSRVASLPAPARERAIEQLKQFHFTEDDLQSLEVDNDGAIFYVDIAPNIPAAAPT